MMTISKPAHQEPSPEFTREIDQPDNRQSQPVGNSVYVFEFSNVVIGSLDELFEDYADSTLATSRMQEETEPLDSVFSKLGISTQ